MANRFWAPATEALCGCVNLYSGAKLYFYETGTLTLLDTYSDSALSTANANPVVADYNGRFGDIFLKLEHYKVVFKTSGDVTIWTKDPVHGAVATIETQGSDIASAATTDIGASSGQYVEVTGTTTITSLGTIDAGVRRVVRFTGALTLTYNATSLILPGDANITTAADDCATFISLGSGNWICVDYQRGGGIKTADIADNAVDETKLKDALIGDFTEVVVTAPDSFLLADASDSGNTKRDTIQGIIDLVGGGGGGKVLQVVQATQSTRHDNTSASTTDTNLTGTITPSSTSNKVLVIVHTSVRVARVTGTDQIRIGTWSLWRGNSSTGTQIDKSSLGRQLASGTTNSSSSHDTYNAIVLDSPATASAQTYTVASQVEAATNNQAETNTNYDNDHTGRIIMVEIDGS